MKTQIEDSEVKFPQKSHARIRRIMGMEGHVERPSFTNSTVVLCEQGRCTLTIKGHNYPLEAGHVAFFLAGNLVTFNSFSEDFEGYYLYYDANITSNAEVMRLLSPALMRVVDKPVLKLTQSQFDWLIEFFNLIEKKQTLLKGTDAAANQTYVALIMTVAIELRDLYRRAMTSDEYAPQPWNTYNRSAQLTREFFTLLTQNENFITHRTVEYYAQRMSITPKHLSAAVKAATGQTAIKMINHFIMLEAQNRLLTSAKTIQQIAEELNFPNASFFGKFFKKQTGLTPRKFRERRSDV